MAVKVGECVWGRGGGGGMVQVGKFVDIGFHANLVVRPGMDRLMVGQSGWAMTSSKLVNTCEQKSVVTFVAL